MDPISAAASILTLTDAAKAAYEVHRRAARAPFEIAKSTRRAEQLGLLLDAFTQIQGGIATDNPSSSQHVDLIKSQLGEIADLQGKLTALCQKHAEGRVKWALRGKAKVDAVQTEVIQMESSLILAILAVQWYVRRGPGHDVSLIALGSIFET
jgi:hypothetical protein